MESLKPAEFTELVTTALNHLHTRQEEELKKAEEEKAKCSHEIADALYTCRQEEAARKEKEELEQEIELKKKAEHEKVEELACEKELVELIKQETRDRLSKEKEECMKACVMQKYGHSIELQMRKEMDMEIPELNVKTDIGAHVSLKHPSPNINIMTPPSKRVQLKTTSPSRISSTFSTPMLGGGATAGAGKGMPAGKGMGAKPKVIISLLGHPSSHRIQ